VTVKLAYDATFEPAAPVIAVQVSRPTGGDAVVVPMLVDTGADCTILPPAIIHALGLPAVGVVGITGVGGTRIDATTHAAMLDLGPANVIAEVMQVDDEPIIGRDVLNQLVLELDGPARQLSVRPPAPRKRKPAKRRVR